MILYLLGSLRESQYWRVNLMAVSVASELPEVNRTFASCAGPGNFSASSAASSSPAWVRKWEVWTYDNSDSERQISSVTSRTECPMLTATAPPLPSKYRLPSSS